MTLSVQEARAEVSYNVAVREMPGEQLAGTPPFNLFYDAIGQTVRAAGAAWGQYLIGSVVVVVQVDLYPESNLPTDAPTLQMDIAGTFRDDAAVVGSSDGYELVEFAPAYKIRTGIGLTSPAKPDVTIRVGENYLKNTLYLDRDPFSRNGPVPPGKTEGFGRFVHELGHALGFDGYNAVNGSFDSTTRRSTFDRYVVQRGGQYYFSGPMAVESYGGPVPLTPNSRGHLGSGTVPDPDAYLCSYEATEVMNGRTAYIATRYTVSDLDVSILCDIGVPCKMLAARAGPDQTVPSGASVTLDGRGTLVSGPTSFNWTQVSGPSVALMNTDAAVATFTAPALINDRSTLSFRLTVTKENYSTSDAVDVTITGGAPANFAGAATTPSASLPASAPDLDQHGLTGSWYDLASSGQGFEVEVFPDLSSPGVGLAQVSWFTYDTTVGGPERQRWYTMSGPVVSGQPNASLTIYQSTGGNFNFPPTTTATQVGTAMLSFDTCTGGRLSYAFTDGSGRTGTLRLTRLTQNVTCSTTPARPANGEFALSGNWYDPAMPGQGLSVEVNPLSGTLFFVWYTFAPDGAGAGPAGQRWYTGQAKFTPGSRSMPVQLFETSQGAFAVPVPAPKTVAVGDGAVAFNSCSDATFNFNFTDGSSGGRHGTIALARLGPVPRDCVP